LGPGVWGLGVRVGCLGPGEGFGFRIWGLGSRVWV